MEETIIEKVTVCTPKRITCDFCGKEIWNNKQQHKTGGTITINLEYGSKYDETNITKDICDECYKKYILQQPSLKTIYEKTIKKNEY